MVRRVSLLLFTVLALTYGAPPPVLASPAPYIDGFWDSSSPVNGTAKACGAQIEFTGRFGLFVPTAALPAKSKIAVTIKTNDPNMTLSPPSGSQVVGPYTVFFAAFKLNTQLGLSGKGENQVEYISAYGSYQSTAGNVNVSYLPIQPFFAANCSETWSTNGGGSLTTPNSGSL
jgi:hypothetical protein